MQVPLPMPASSLDQSIRIVYTHLLPPLGLYVNVSAAIGCILFPQHSCSGPFPLYCPTVDLRFVGYITRGYGLGSKVTPLL